MCGFITYVDWGQLVFVGVNWFCTHTFLFHMYLLSTGQCFTLTWVIERSNQISPCTCVCQLFLLVSSIPYIFPDVPLCRSTYSLPLFHHASSWAAAEKNSAFIESQLALRSDPTFNFHSRGAHVINRCPSIKPAGLLEGCLMILPLFFVSTICGELFSEMCCTLLQYEPEVVLEHWFDCAPYLRALQRRKPGSSTGAEQGSTERKLLFVNPKVCLFLADSLRARRLFTLSLRHLMYVALLLVQRCVDIWPECFCNQFFSSRCLWAEAV